MAHGVLTEILKKWLISLLLCFGEHQERNAGQKVQ